ARDSDREDAGDVSQERAHSPTTRPPAGPPPFPSTTLFRSSPTMASAAEVRLGLWTSTDLWTTPSPEREPHLPPSPRPREPPPRRALAPEGTPPTAARSPGPSRPARTRRGTPVHPPRPAAPPRCRRGRPAAGPRWPRTPAVPRRGKRPRRSPRRRRGR